MSGSPADKAGLKAGDVITAIDGNAITTADDLTAQVGAHQPSDEVTVTVTRNGSSKDIKVTLGSRRLALRSPSPTITARGDAAVVVVLRLATSAGSAAAPSPR